MTFSKDERVYCPDGREHSYTHYEQAAEISSNTLTVWYVCAKCSYCLIKKFDPSKPGCTLVVNSDFTTTDQGGAII